MTEIDESCDDDAMGIACIQELDEFVTRKLRRYPIDAVAVAAAHSPRGCSELYSMSTNSRLTRSRTSREMESHILDPARPV